MNAQSIIKDLTLSRDERLILSRLAELFDHNTPDALYMDYYELSNELGAPADQWERFLDIPEIYRYRTGKIAKLQEFAAIKAMKQLEQQGQIPGASAVSALKELSKLSKQLNSNSQNKQKILLTYVSPKQYENKQPQTIQT
jgi:hypothetical protein